MKAQISKTSINVAYNLETIISSKDIISSIYDNLYTTSEEICEVYTYKYWIVNLKIYEIGDLTPAYLDKLITILKKISKNDIGKIEVDNYLNHQLSNFNKNWANNNMEYYNTYTKLFSEFKTELKNNKKPYNMTSASPINTEPITEISSVVSKPIDETLEFKQNFKLTEKFENVMNEYVVKIDTYLSNIDLEKKMEKNEEVDRKASELQHVINIKPLEID